MENMTGDKLKSIVALSLSQNEGGVIMKFADSALGKVYNEGFLKGFEQGFLLGFEQGYQQGFEQINQQGFEQINQQGFHKDHQQIIQSGRKELACALIDVKFGHTPETERLKQHIATIDDPDRLHTINETLKTAATLADVIGLIGH